MLTKADFQQAIRDVVSSFPTVAPLYQAGDPRILQQLDAMATMLAMYSSQLEVALTEPFDKVRPSTVLADATMRGIIPKGKPARVRIRVVNNNGSAVTLSSGRFVLDSEGNYYRVEVGTTITAGGTNYIEASQYRLKTIEHIVESNAPFYQIEIPISDDESDLCALRVYDGAGDFAYRERFTNTLPGERVYHVETDSRQRVYVRFGVADLVGVQPVEGDTITVVVSYTKGQVTPAFDSPYALETMLYPSDAGLQLFHDALLTVGAKPPSIDMLRDLARYPSVYNMGAVYLGEFDFLVRRHFPDLKFLSVWNESAEEAVRGANLSSINTLFVACLSSSEQELTINQIGDEFVQPIQVLKEDRTATQQAIENTIKAADSSYRVRFVTPVRYAIKIKMVAIVSTVYVASEVAEQIKEVLLTEFGETSEFARRGRSRLLYKRVYALLKDRVRALSHGDSDISVVIEDLDTGLNRPELWRYVNEDSLTVDVVSTNVTNPSFGS